MRWVIGDIHGMSRPLRTILDAVRRRDWNPRFIFVGDYVNRGPDSRGVIDLLLSLPDALFVRGNHDDIFDLVLRSDCYVCHDTGPDAVSAFKWFSNHGLMNTLQSYGLDYAEVESVARRPTLNRVRQLLAVVPGSHREFIQHLRPFVEFDDMFVVHAMWDRDTPDDFSGLEANARLRHRLLWGRYRGDEVSSPKHWRRTGYFGHTPVLNYGLPEAVPMRGPKIVMVDTGAALGPTGRLSALCADTGALIQSDPEGMLLESA
jgi:diadenosine tetraphosphatase ApaH/serine/threonine PP2A family protein phosphatase